MRETVNVAEQLASLMELAPAGFAIALHVRFASALYLFQTYPDAWLAEYTRDGLVMRDPTVAWALAHTGRRDWSLFASDDPGGVMARAAAHGLRHGVTISIERGGSRSIASFVHPERPFTEAEAEEIEQRMTALHEATASARPLDRSTREAIRRLSIAFTHP
ncbi:Autoinducer binding domain protein [Rubellimicrobium thermophilum DSM 16684]|uniref:Autoinducer binding domain protein n=1 Tax=Rubellimicrobium thermophilum DSM 16684 TaxID=1123069 RepID=S9SLF7_9RHOB|nr:autoinducer binding domain-containing protein [Rubellimicrobium thermophilum]EPX87219.1 Autoinducer binding domain protein [Rubellimicrobium thermophilum DSM 16684]